LDFLKFCFSLFYFSKIKGIFFWVSFEFKECKKFFLILIFDLILFSYYHLVSLFVLSFCLFILNFDLSLWGKNG